MWIGSHCLTLFIATGLCRNALCRSTSHKGLSAWQRSYTESRSPMPPPSSLPPQDLTLLTAAQISPYLKSGAVSVESYARALISRVDQRDDVVKAWRHIGRKHIIEQAQALDSIPEAERGPLHGIAVGIEDIMDTKDMPTRFGSALYEDNKPNIDAAPVSILRDAGAIIFGKTTTTEFTVLNEGPDTTNPADRQRTPGGSAAGSAAAVADFQVPLSLGTQSGGSVIRPASYTGIFAMKPTHNAMSTEGIKVVSWDIDTCGFFARTVEDLELIANIFALERKKDKLEPIPLSATRIALVETPFFEQAGNGTRAAMSRATEILKEAGVKSVEKVDLPFENDNAETLNRIHKTIFGYEAKNAFLADVRHDKQHELDPKIRKYVEDPKYSNVEMIEALEAYEHMRTDFDKFARKYDAFITPSAVDIAPEGLDDMGASIFNFLWTGLQTPVVHVPAFTGEHGMPVGLSIISGRYNDERLLQIVDVLSKPLMAKGGWKIEQKNAAQKHNAQLPNSHVSASYVASSQQQRLEDEKPKESPWTWLRDSVLPKALAEKL